MRHYSLLMLFVSAVAATAGAGSLRPAESSATESPDADAESSGEKRSSPDPTLTPPVSWLPEPVPLPEAEATREAEMKPYTEKIPGSDVTFDMVPIPGGTFLMGSPAGEEHRQAHEGPQVEVEVEPFWMGKCEVTWDEYELWGLGYDLLLRKQAKREPDSHDQVADAITRPTKPYSDMTFGMGREGYPAICMTHLAAKVYCKWLSAKTGRYYRLPTEAEWEYACRAGTSTAYSYGDDPEQLGEYAWYFLNSLDKYHPVGKKKPNPWGLHDMHGNVAEWVLDGFKPDAYTKVVPASRKCPLMPPEDIYPRVVRGGSWLDDPDQLRSAARRPSEETWKMGDPQMPKSIWYHTDAFFVGFRVLRPLKPPAAEEAPRFDVDAAQKRDFLDYMEYLAGRQ